MGRKAEQNQEKVGVQPSDYEGPTTIALLISQWAPEVDIETMNLIVHLPQYTQLDDDYMGATRLMEVLGSLYDVPRDESYIKKAEQQRRQITTAVDEDPQLKGIVAQLESYYETRTKKWKENEMPQLSPEVEKFLREMDIRFRQG